MIIDAIRRLFGGRRTPPAAARAEPVVDMNDAGRLAERVRAGDPEVTNLAGNLVEVAIRHRSADLLRALCAIPGYGPQLADYFRWHLIQACDTTDTAAITWMLDAGIEPLPHRSGDTALHHAGTAGVAKALLDAGADPNRLDSMGRPASACLLGRSAFDAVEVVLDAGGDVAALARCAATEQSPDGMYLRVRMSAFLAGLPGVKPWFQDLVLADPMAPWAMTLLARMSAAEEAESQSTGGL